MEKVIYRGYDFTQKNPGQLWVISKDGKDIHVIDSENNAMAWVDAKKRLEQRSKRNETDPSPWS